MLELCGWIVDCGCDGLFRERAQVAVLVLHEHHVRRAHQVRKRVEHLDQIRARARDRGDFGNEPRALEDVGHVLAVGAADRAQDVVLAARVVPHLKQEEEHERRRRSRSSCRRSPRSAGPSAPATSSAAASSRSRRASPTGPAKTAEVAMETAVAASATAGARASPRSSTTTTTATIER